MHKLILIIQREFMAKVKSRAYLVLIFLSPLLMLAMFAAIFYFVNKDQTEDVDKPKVLWVGSTEHFQWFEQKFEDFNFQKLDDLEYLKAKNMFDQGLYEGVVYSHQGINEVIGVKELPLSAFKFTLQKLLWLSSLKSDPALKLGSDVFEKDQVNLTEKQNYTTVQKWIKGIVAVGAGYLIMMFVIIYGNSVMRSIIEEKNSRVIEVLICTVKPFQLMMGKIIGNALAGLLQFLIWGVLLFLGLFLMQNFFDLQSDSTQTITEIFEVIWQINYVQLLVGFIFFFLSGYLLYSGFYTAVGAAVNSETDTQQFVHPILLPLMFAVYIGIATVVNGNPHGDTAMLFSLIPFTSPIVMTMRIPYGVPFWQIATSLALLLVSFVTTVYIASKIYRIGILTYGNKPSFKQLIRWMVQR